MLHIENGRVGMAFVSCLLLASVANAQSGPSNERVSFLGRYDVRRGSTDKR
jgi:hypothetical protein